MEPRVDVLMSTYNGEKYLAEQLDSIFKQTHSNLMVWVRDDCSVDGTFQMIERYSSVCQDRLKVLSSDDGNLGCAKSFMSLLNSSTADYVMFADQDDIWLPNKIELALQELQKIESEKGAEFPVLVFGDLMAVDQDLTILHKSFWASQKNDVSIVSDWRKVFARNVVTGCTIMLNRAAVSASLPFPEIDILHDQWVALNVAKKGTIMPISEPTILYRQHSDNVEGAKLVGLMYMFGRLRFKLLRKNFVLVQYLSREFGASVAALVFYKLWVNIKRIF